MARELIGYFGPNVTDEDIADAILAAHHERKAKAEQTAATPAEPQHGDSDREAPAANTGS
jgi:hypothetical protein